MEGSHFRVCVCTGYKIAHTLQTHFVYKTYVYNWEYFQVVEISGFYHYFYFLHYILPLPLLAPWQFYNFKSLLGSYYN